MQTKLDAVNTMLRVIGQVPVLTIPEGGLSDAAIAAEVLDEYNKELQSEGWTFNQTFCQDATPAQDGFIRLVDNILSIKSTRADKQLTARYNDDTAFLYDVREASFMFEDTQKVDYIFFVPDTEDLPPMFYRYLVIRAARVFAHRTVGDQTTDAYSTEDEARARAAWLTAVARDEELNLFSTSDSFRPNTTTAFSSLYRY